LQSLDCPEGPAPAGGPRAAAHKIHWEDPGNCVPI